MDNTDKLMTSILEENEQVDCLIAQILQISSEVLIGPEDFRRKIVRNYLSMVYSMNGTLLIEEDLEAIKMFFTLWKNSIRQVYRLMDGTEINKQQIINQYMTEFFQENQRLPTLQDLAELFRIFGHRNSSHPKADVHSGRNNDSGKIKKGTHRKRSRKKAEMIISVKTDKRKIIVDINVES